MTTKHSIGDGVISRVVWTACGGAMLVLGCGDATPGSGAGESVEHVRAALTGFVGRLYVVQGDDLFRVDPATGVGTMLGPANAWSGDVKMTVSN